MLHASCYMYFDTHAHVNFNAFKSDGDEVLRRSLEAGMQVVNVGSQYSTSLRALEYARKFEAGVYAAIGIHPVHLKKGKFIHQEPDELTEEEILTVGEEFDYQKYLELAKDPLVVAIGEIGLDYHHFDPPRVDERSSSRVEAGEGDDVEFLKNLQKTTLLEFIKLANEVQKPVMLHCWDGYGDLLEILQANPVAKKGIIHSFIGSHKTAKQFIALGYKIGLNGIVTYGDSYGRLIREIDLQDMVLETDCPYLTPRPLEKGLRNEPLFVEEVAKKIASVKNVSVEDVARITTQNAKAILNLSL